MCNEASVEPPPPMRELIPRTLNLWPATDPKNAYDSKQEVVQGFEKLFQGMVLSSSVCAEIGFKFIRNLPVLVFGIIYMTHVKT